MNMIGKEPLSALAGSEPYIKGNLREFADQYQRAKAITAMAILDSAEKIRGWRNFPDQAVSGNFTDRFFGNSFTLAKELKLALVGRNPDRTHINVANDSPRTPLRFARGIIFQYDL